MAGQSVAERAFEVILLAVTNPMGLGSACASKVVAGREMRRGGGLHSRLLRRGEAKRLVSCRSWRGHGKNLRKTHSNSLTKRAIASRWPFAAAPFEVSSGASSCAASKGVAALSGCAQGHFFSHFLRRAQERCTAGQPHFPGVHRFLVFLEAEIGVRSSVAAQALR